MPVTAIASRTVCASASTKMPTASTWRGSMRTIGAASTGATYRGLAGKKLNPSRSAPASTAAAASSARVMPQTLTHSGRRRTDRSREKLPQRRAPGSGALMKLSPTRNARTPIASKRRRSAGERKPLSMTTVRSCGTSPSSARPVSSEVAKVSRSRLLMPTTVASDWSARSSCSRVWTSTSAVISSSRPSATSSRNTSARSTAAIRRKASAPAARASYTWYGSKRKSFRRSGSCTRRRIAVRCSRLPSKKRSSVRTEIAAAPAAS